MIKAHSQLWDEATSSSRRLVGLDLLRGAAAYGVLITHNYSALSAAVGFDVEPVTGFFGIAGVEIFFALSGFLIGGVLLGLADKSMTPRNLRVFLVRRWMRTLPVYYLAFVTYLVVPGMFAPHPPAEPLAYATFTQNIWYQRLGFFNVSWTLAIEEWFYVALTVVIGAATLVWRGREAYIAAVLTITIGGAAFRIAGVYAGLDFSLHRVVARLDAISYGALLAYLLRQPSWHVLRAHSGLLALLGTGALVLLYALMRMKLFPLGTLGWAVFYTALPFCSVLCLPWAIFVQINNRLLLLLAAFSAAVSYPLYVWHNEIGYAVMNTRFHPGTGLINFAIVLGVSSLVAYATHVLVEAPFMRLRPNFRSLAQPAASQVPEGALTSARHPS